MAHIIWFYGLEQRYPIWGNYVLVQKIIFSQISEAVPFTNFLPIFYRLSWKFDELENGTSTRLLIKLNYRLFSRSTWFKVFKSTILMRQTRLVQWCRKSHGITVSDYRFWCLFIWNLECLHVSISTQSFHRQLDFRNWFQVNRFWTWNSRARHMISKTSKFATQKVSDKYRCL